MSPQEVLEDLQRLADKGKLCVGDGWYQAVIHVALESQDEECAQKWVDKLLAEEASPYARSVRGE